MKKLIFTLFTLLSLGSTMVVQADYYVAGTMNGWNAGDNNYKMSGSGPYSVTQQLNSGSHEFKVTDGTWDQSWAGYDNAQSNVTLSTKEGNISFTLSTTSNVTFYFNASTSTAYVHAEAVVVPSYTFSSGTTIYYDFTAYNAGVNLYNSDWNNEWKSDVSSIISKTLTSDWEVTASSNLFKSAASSWNIVKCSTLPTSGQNMLVSTDGVTFHWDTYSGEEIMPTIQLHSNLTNPSWASSENFAIAAGNATASLTIAISQGNSYQFGVMVNGEWRSNGAAFDRFNNSAVIPAGNTTNCTFIADATGDYTFTWTYATNTLSVEYPEALSVALTGLNANQFVGDGVTVTATSNLTNASYAYQLKIDDGEYAALSANPYTFAAAGTYTFKVTATGDEGTVDATKAVTVYVPMTLYFVNKEGWDNIHAYAYGDGDIKNANWPGEAMTSTAYTTAGHSYGVYSVRIAKDRYTTIIFNNGNSGEGNQTANLTIDDAKPYFYNGTWYATLAECDPVLETYHLYVRDLTGWDTFDVYAWGDSEFLGGWPGKTAANSTTTIDGVTYKVYDFEAIEDATIEMNLIFHNNVGQDLPGDYRQNFNLTTARNCTISVSGIAAWEGLSGVKRFRACEPLEHVYGYQYDAEGPTGTEWPGDELIADGEGWYSYIVTKGRTVIFNNGTGEGAMQTGDFAYTDADPVADECAVWQGDTNVSDKIYMFTIDDCDAACTVTYERDVTNGNYGTICLPYNAVSVTGATLYNIAGKSGDGYGEGIYIDQEDELLMGVPYIFLASADKIVVRYWEGQSFTPSADHLYSHNGLVGFINDGEYYTVTANAHNYILYNNGLYFVNSEAKIASNRAFIDWSDVPGDAPAPVTSRRCIQVYQTPTGWTIVPEEGHDACRKVLRDGSLLIERNGNTYNAVGQMVK